MWLGLKIGRWKDPTHYWVVSSGGLLKPLCEQRKISAVWDSFLTKPDQNTARCRKCVKKLWTVVEVRGSNRAVNPTFPKGV